MNQVPPRPKPSLLELILVHMTREEFKVCFSVDFLADGAEEFEGHFPDMRACYSTPGWENSDAWVEHLRRVMRYLTFELGYKFEFVELKENGSIQRSGDFIEPQNILYAMGLMTNQVNYLDALRVTIDNADRIGLPKEPFYEAYDLVKESVQERNAKINVQRHRQWESEMDVVLSSVGIKRVGGRRGPSRPD